MGIVESVPRGSSDIKKSALSVPALVRDKEYRALAAIATTSDPKADEALLALVGEVDGSRGALSWLLVLTPTDEQWALIARALPAKIAAPEELVPALRKLWGQATAAPASPLADAAAAFLLRMPELPEARSAAVRFVKAGASAGALHDAGLTVLSESKDLAERRALLANARAAGSLAERLTRLDALGVPSSDPERKELRKALEEVRSTSGFAPAVVGALASRLPSPWMQRWFYGEWPYGITQLANREFGHALGRRGLSALIRESMGPDHVTTVYAAADGLVAWADDASVVELLVRAKHVLPDAAARFLEKEGAPCVRDEAWRLLFADPTSRLVAGFAAAATPEGLSAAAAKHNSRPRVVERLAEVAAQLVVRTSTRDAERLVPTDEWTLMVKQVTNTLGLRFLALLIPKIPQVSLPDELLELAESDVETLHALLAAGFADEVMARANTRSAALGLLRTSAALLGPDDCEVLVQRVGEKDTPEYAEALRLVGAVHPDVLHGGARDLVDRHTDPVASQRPLPGLVATTVKIAVQFGLADVSSWSTDGDRLTHLIGQRRTDLIDAGGAWAAAMKPSDVDMDALVEATVIAGDRLATPHPALTSLRTQLAEVMVREADDPDETFALRAKSLLLAARSDPLRARAAALLLAGDDDRDLNHAAARVLVSTDGSLADAERLRELHDEETDGDARDLFGQALAQITVQDAAAAINRILELTGETPRAKIVAIVAPADGTDEAERLVSCVNQVIGSNGGSTLPTHFVTAATSLADELMLTAIVGTHDSGTPTVSAAEVQRIRLRSDVNAGSLTRRQQVLDQFPWVFSVGALHNLRTAHPTKKGEVRPRDVNERDRDRARGLLGQVVSGWLSSMGDLGAPTAKKGS